MLLYIACVGNDVIVGKRHIACHRSAYRVMLAVVGVGVTICIIERAVHVITEVHTDRRTNGQAFNRFDLNEEVSYPALHFIVRLGIVDHGHRVHHVREVRCSRRLFPYIFAETVNSSLRITNRIPRSHCQCCRENRSLRRSVIVHCITTATIGEGQVLTDAQPFANVEVGVHTECQALVVTAQQGTVLIEVAGAEHIRSPFAATVNRETVVVNQCIFMEDLILPIGTAFSGISSVIEVDRIVRVFTAWIVGFCPPGIETFVPVGDSFRTTGHEYFCLCLIQCVHYIQLAPSVLNTPVGIEADSSLAVRTTGFGSNENHTVGSLATVNSRGGSVLHNLHGLDIRRSKESNVLEHDTIYNIDRRGLGLNGTDTTDTDLGCCARLTGVSINRYTGSLSLQGLVHCSHWRLLQVFCTDAGHGTCDV